MSYYDLYDSVVGLLKCSQCNKRVDTSVIVCSHGHATCTYCSQRNITCKLCSSLFLNNNHIFINSILEATEKREYFLERLTQALECPVCYNQIKKCDICVNGHGVCKHCARLTQHCPLCREPYVYNYSSLIESILDVLQRRHYKCTNWSQCRTACKFSKLLDHEINCDKSYCYCIVENCKWSGSINNLPIHVTTAHLKLVIPGYTTTLQVHRKGNGTINMLKTEDNTFWIVCRREDNGIKLAIQIHDFQCPYTAQITFISGQTELKLTQSILTMKDNVLEAIFNEFNCLLIPNSIAEKFDGDKNSKCCIKILKQNLSNENNGRNSAYSSLAHQVMVMLFVLNVILFCTKTAK